MTTEATTGGAATAGDGPRPRRTTLRTLTTVAALLLPSVAPAQQPDPFGEELAEIEAEEEAIGEAEAERKAAAEAIAAALTEAPVTDPDTGLEWTPEMRVLEGAFFVARLHCQNLVAGGETDWRLPEVEELRGIVGRLDEVGIRGETAKLVSGEIKERTVSSIGVNAEHFQPNEELVMYVLVPGGKIRQTSVENRLDKKDIGVLCVRP